MNFTFLVYGLRLAADVFIPGLEETPAFGEPDLRVWLESKPPWLEALSHTAETLCYVTPEREDCCRPALTVHELGAGKYFRLIYADGTTFVLDHLATRVWAAWPAPLTREDAATYLLGPILGFMLRRRGITCLHASAVAVDGEAIALVGSGGAGKSTTAACFAQRGYPVLCDDVSALELRGESFFVRSAYPRVCLWPNAVQALFGRPDALPRLTPNWEKCYLPLGADGRQFQREPLGLRAIYLLAERSAEARVPVFERVPSGVGLIALVQNTYMNYLLDPMLRAREFDLLGRLLERVPLRQVTPHPDLVELPRLCEAIVADCRSLRSPAPKTKAVIA